MGISDKEVDEIIDQLNAGKYESEMASIFEDLKKDDNLMAAVDKVFEETEDLEEIQCKIILLIQEHAKHITPDDLTPGEMGIDHAKIAKDIAKLTRDISEEKFKKRHLDEDKEFDGDGEFDGDRDLEGVKIDKKDKHHTLSGKAKKDFKKMLKNFAVYAVYKVMNPKRIAGETKKDNYKHNMYMGGEKLASKHTGGRKEEVSGYSNKFVKGVKSGAKAFKKGGGFER